MQLDKEQAVQAPAFCAGRACTCEGQVARAGPTVLASYTICTDVTFRGPLEAVKSCQPHNLKAG